MHIHDRNGRLWESFVIVLLWCHISIKSQPMVVQLRCDELDRIWKEADVA